MTDYLTYKNGSKNIDKIIKNAITDKEFKIARLKKQIASLNKQHTDGVYYTNIALDGESPIVYLTMSIFSIIKEILSGFSDATDKLKKDVGVSLQKGGENTEQLQTIDRNTDALNNAIDKATQKTDELAKGVKDQASDLAKGVKDQATDLTKGVKDMKAKYLGDGDASIADMAISKAKEVGEASIKRGIQWSEDVISTLIDMGMELMGESEILDTPLDELSPALNKKILLFSGLLKELSENPATREAIKEIAEAVAISVVEILKEIRPEINKITDQAVEMLEEVGEKSIRGATATGLSMGQAFVAEIPWVGGVIDLMLALGKGFNSIMETYKVVVDRGGQLGVEVAKTAVNTEQTVMRGKDRVENATTKAMNTINSATGSQIQSGGKRIRKTMKLFDTTLPKLKYPVSGPYGDKRRSKKTRNTRKTSRKQ